jgi:hypothetical protein
MGDLYTGSGGEGAIHVCEHTECRLPAADWYLASKQKAAAEAPRKPLPLPEASGKPKVLLEAPSDKRSGSNVEGSGNNAKRGSEDAA